MIKRCFSLFELLIAVGILGIFLFICSDTLVSTLTMKEVLEETYGKEKIKSVGWNIMYQDLANAVGIYYLDGTDWAGLPKDKKKNTKAKKTQKKAKKKGPKMMKIDLFEYFSEPDSDAPFMKLIVSKGRMRSTPEKSSLGFREVKYYLDSHPEDSSKGYVIYRVESIWDEQQGENFEEDEVDFVSEYRKYIIVEGIENVTHAVYSGTEWLEEWDSTEKGDLPLALKIEYTHLDEEDYLEKVIPIPISYQIIDEPVEGDF